MKLKINRKTVQLDAPADMPLLWALRDVAGLTGTKFGCGEGLCGACTVHLNGEPTRSCQLRLGDIGTGEITTIEGLSGEIGELLKAAWARECVPQCGYCQAGQLMSASALLANDPAASDADIDAWMSGNLCRCGTYKRIRKAIRSVRDGA